MKNLFFISMFLFLFSSLSSASAETVYVVDKVTVGLYTGANSEQPLIKNMVSGDVLEKLERTGNDMRVRLADGTEGWVDARYVMTTLPARALLVANKRSLEKLKAELDSTTQKLELAESALSMKQQPTVTSEDNDSESGADVGNRLFDKLDMTSILLLLALSFAMLIIGVITGVLWAKELHRRKTGGMRIRISGM